MTNERRKGTRNERFAREIWEEAGFRAYSPANTTYGDNDVFGLFDLIAVRASTRETHGVQVKTNGAQGITSWALDTEPFREAGWRTFYAVRHDREGWRLIEAVDGELPVVVDERDGDEIRDECVSWLSE